MYNHQLIEKKWQERWLKDGVWSVDNQNIRDQGSQPEADPPLAEKTRDYVLDMFPYPSGAGLHVGHPKGYTATDIYTRYLRMNGRQVLHPMGWDAFGLPAENYAIKQGVPPAETTSQNIETFRRQIQSLGLSYDWAREVNTSSPDYYRWTQWMFLFLYKYGLAYKKKAPVNWCDSCQTVLAREQVIDGACERCKNSVIQKELEQWFLKITEYADRLLSGLDEIDWPDQIKEMQRNWIGKSRGAMIGFQVSGIGCQIDVFTTRPDTLFGATYLVLAPEHHVIDVILGQQEKDLRIENEKDARDYVAIAQKKTELERTQLQKEKTGVELKGVKAINPATGEEIPIWVADYVIGSYGTGAIMAVPAHDERDFEFAKKYDLPIASVIASDPAGERSNLEIASSSVRQPNRAPLGLAERPSRNDILCYTGTGTMINSGEFNGMDSEEAKWKITEKVGGKKVTQYRLRDWLISRQRYWGAPIPIVYCEICAETKNKKQKTSDDSQLFCEIDGVPHAIIPVPEEQLPIMLPTDVDFKPHGKSPLAGSQEFQKNVMCPQCGGDAKREVDTMDTFMCSSWYYLRFCDPYNKKEFASQEALKAWMPVDTYVGGAEHAVLHLMYARFVHKVLYDHGYIPKEVGDEPFVKLRNVGLVLAEDGRKMSKSLGNVINPDDVVKEYGADSVRMYEMFMGPFEDALPWQPRGIVGMRRFLDRVYAFYDEHTPRPSPRGEASSSPSPKACPESGRGIREGRGEVSLLEEGGSLTGETGGVMRVLHKTIKKVTEDIENMRFNTAISALMICLNELEGQVSGFGYRVSGEELRMFLKLLFPFAPHLSQELWTEVLKQDGYLDTQPWSEYDEALIKDEQITIAIQINGKVRGQMTIAPDYAEQEVISQSLAQESVTKWIEGKEVVKTMYVTGRIVSIVVK